MRGDSGESPALSSFSVDANACKSFIICKFKRNLVYMDVKIDLKRGQLMR